MRRRKSLGRGDYITLRNMSTGETISKRIAEVENLGGRIVYIVGPWWCDKIGEYYIAV